jgi:uncharacterized SAM-binding protein YcdF (DUF218 family)
MLVYPLSQALLLCLLGLLALWLGWQRRGAAAILLGTGWLYLCSTAFVADQLMGVLERRYPAKALSVVPEADVILLLGGSMRGYTHMGSLSDLNQHADRLVHAVALYKAGKAPQLLLSGGSAPGEVSEARQMADVLEVMGVPPGDILLEEQSRDTYGNALYSAPLLRERGLEQVLLVTSAFHMPRAVATFEAQGLTVIPAPADFKRLVRQSIVPAWLPGSGNLARTTLALHELVGYEVYRFRGRL